MLVVGRRPKSNSAGVVELVPVRPAKELVQSAQCVLHFLKRFLRQGYTIMRRLLPLFSLLLAVFALAGCVTLDPQPMGRGYGSYDKPYKSVRGVEARDVGYEFDVTKNDAVIEDVRTIARDLVVKLDAAQSFNLGDIYLEIPAQTAFYNSFDYALREEMTKQGYTLVSAPKDAVVVEFVAREINPHYIPEYVAYEKDGHVSVLRKGDQDYKKMYVALALDVKKNVPGKLLGGVYDVPAYDYKPAGHLKFDLPKKQGCGKCIGQKTVCVACAKAAHSSEHKCEGKCGGKCEKKCDKPCGKCAKNHDNTKEEICEKKLP